MHKFKRALAVIIALTMLISMCACKGKETTKSVELDLFAPKQALGIVSTLVNDYYKVQPNISIRITYDEGAMLAARIEAGYKCDIYIADDPYFLDWLDIEADPQVNLNHNDRIFSDTRKEILEGPAGDDQETATYSIAVVKPSENKDAAQGFIDFFMSSTSDPIFEEWGFTRK